MVYLFQIFYDYLVIYCYFKGHEMQKNDVFSQKAKFSHTERTEFLSLKGIQKIYK